MDELNDRFKKAAEKFSLIPSSGIWQKVEADIRKRKRKKRFIIFFFLLAGISTGALFLFNNNSTTIHTPAALSKNEALTGQSVTQQNDSTEKSKPFKENSSAHVIFNENKEQGITNKIYPQKKQPLHPGSSLTTDTTLTFVTQTISHQNNVTEDSLQQAEISTTITTAILPFEFENVNSDSVSAIPKDTVQTEPQTDSLLITKADTIKTDSVIARKDTLKPVENKSKWSIALGSAPALNFTKQEEQGDYQFISNYRDSTDKNLLTWNYHLAINYKIVPLLEVFTGVGIIHFEQELLSKQAVYHYDTLISPIAGPSGPDTIIILSKANFNINGDSAGTVKNKFTYLEIPIGIRFNYLRVGNFGISFQPEVSFNKLIKSGGYIYNYENFTYEKIKDSDLKTWLVSYGIGLSFQYAIRKKLYIEFTPYYKSFQKSIYNTAYPINQRFQQAEFRLSLRYLVK